MTVARDLAVDHYLVVDNPMSFALSTTTSAAVSTVTEALDFPVEEAMAGVALVLVEDITD